MLDRSSNQALGHVKSAEHCRSSVHCTTSNVNVGYTRLWSFAPSFFVLTLVRRGRPSAAPAPERSWASESVSFRVCGFSYYITPSLRIRYRYRVFKYDYFLSFSTSLQHTRYSYRYGHDIMKTICIVIANHESANLIFIFQPRKCICSLGLLSGSMICLGFVLGQG